MYVYAVYAPSSGHMKLHVKLRKPHGFIFLILLGHSVYPNISIYIHCRLLGRNDVHIFPQPFHTPPESSKLTVPELLRSKTLATARKICHQRCQVFPGRSEREVSGVSNCQLCWKAYPRLSKIMRQWPYFLISILHGKNNKHLSYMVYVGFKHMGVPENWRNAM